MANRRREESAKELAPAAEDRPWRRVACLGVLAAAVLIADGAVVRNDWVTWDDHATLYDNKDFNPPSLQSLIEIWSEPRGHLFVPVTYTYWWLLASIAWSPSGLPPVVFHAGSVALHVIATWLVFAIAARVVRHLPAACCGAALFAVHPVQVETVAWASGAKDLLCGVLSLAAIVLFLKRRDFAAPRARYRWITLATLAYALALLAKPSAVVLPFMLVPVDWLVDRRMSRDSGLTAIGWLALALPIALLTRFVQPALTIFAPPYWQRPLVALDALGFYLRSLVWPFRLAFVYGRTPEVQLNDLWLNAGVAIVAGIAVGLAARRWPVVAAAAAVFVAALLPYLGLVPFDFQMYSTVSDHYLYLAMVGPALLAAFILAHRPVAWYAGFSVIAVILAVVSHEQAGKWQGKMTLLRHAIAMNPQHAAPHYAMGVHLGRAGDLPAAEQEYRRALEIWPGDLESRVNLAHLLTRQGKHQEALEHYQRALAAAPNDTLKMNNVALSLAALGRIDEAIRLLRLALLEEDSSNDDLLHGNLGRLLLAQGNREEARAELEKALEINPDLEIARQGMLQLDAKSD